MHRQRRQHDPGRGAATAAPHHRRRERDAKNGEEYQQYIEAFKKQIEVDEEDLWEQISRVSKAGAPRLYRAAVIEATVDGDISKEEYELLKQLADRLGIEHDKRLIEVTQRQWK